MPYSVKESDGKFCVHWGDGDAIECYDTQKEAEDAMATMSPPDEDSIAERVRKTVMNALAELGLVSRPARPPEVVDGDRQDEIAQAKIDAMRNERQAEIKRALSIQNIWEQCWGAALSDEDVWWTPLEMFIENDTLFAIFAAGGKLYKRSISVQDDELLLGDPVEVAQKFEERVSTGRDAVKTTLTRQKDGRVRWFSVSSTSVLNRSGLIDSRELFDNFERHCRETGEYPIRMFWHQGEEFRTGQADFVARDGDVYITSGLYDQDNLLAEIEIAAREAYPDRYGESIGFVATKPPTLEEIAEGVYVPVYREGVNTEISTLPETLAAALYTCTRGATPRRDNMRKEVKDELLRIAAVSGRVDDVEEFIAQVDQTNRAIKQDGLITREAEAPVEETEIPAPDAEAPVTVELDDESVAAIVESMVHTPIFQERLNTAVELAQAPLRAQLGEYQRLVEELRQMVERDVEEIEEPPAPMPIASGRRMTLSYRPRDRHAQNGANDPVGLDSVAASTLAMAPTGR